MTFDPTQKLTRENFSALPPLCTDGAWGTELQKLGIKPGQMCDGWNFEHPDKVLQVAQSYVDAGSEVILSNTFSGNRVILAKHGMEGQVFEINKAGAAISKRAASGQAYVFASVGPTGLMPTIGQGTPEELEEVFAEQARGLEAGGADAIVVETLSDIVEAEAALRGCLRATSIPVGLSFTFDAGENGAFTMMGVSVAAACEVAARGGASFVGANCGRGIETFLSIAELFAQCNSGLPVWIKGNAGLPVRDAAGNISYSATPETYAAAVGPLLGAGAKFIGGCCGSTPTHIRAVAQALASLR